MTTKYYCLSLWVFFCANVLVAQTDSLVDVFPLAQGNQWTYRFLTYGSTGSGVEMYSDSGLAIYAITGALQGTDSTRWFFRVQRNLLHYYQLYTWDTTWHIRDTANFEIVESHQGQHQLYRNDPPGSIHHDVFPFTKDFNDTTLILRYRRIGQGDTVSFRSTRPGSPVSPFFRSTFTFQKGVGEIRFRYDLGIMDIQDVSEHYLLSSIITTAGTPPEAWPGTLTLSQNYPNPFNPSTRIDFAIVAANDGSGESENRRVGGPENVTLRVFDLLGREVTTLVNERKLPGAYSVVFDAGDLSSGVYFYRLQAGSFSQTRKLVLMR